MFENAREDIRAWEFPKGHNPVKKFFYLLFRQELHAVLIYRFGHWAALHCRVPVLRPVCLFLYFFLNKYSEIVAGIYIWPITEIGPGLKVEHFGSVFIGGTSFGRNLRVSTQVIIGHIGGGRGGGRPTLGDDVWVGAGAKILGEVKIGDGVKIGANAVVLADVPEGAIAVGVPAVIKWPKGAGPMGEPSGG